MKIKDIKVHTTNENYIEKAPKVISIHILFTNGRSIWLQFITGIDFLDLVQELSRTIRNILEIRSEKESLE